MVFANPSAGSTCFCAKANACVRACWLRLLATEIESAIPGILASACDSHAAASVRRCELLGTAPVFCVGKLRMRFNSWTSAPVSGNRLAETHIDALRLTLVVFAVKFAVSK